MTVTTNVPKPSFGPNGFIAPSEQVVLAGVQTDIDQAFGGGVNPALNTPQGQLASSTTAIIANTNDLFVHLVNMTDPAFSTGRMQDGIGRIYFVARNPAQPTVVQAQCLGGQGVEIPTGALALAADGNIYTCTAGAFIPAGGTVTLPFACNVSGPIACPAGSLNQIFRAIPGWDSVINADDGVLGNLVESPREFEARRAASVAQNSRGSLPSVLGSVLSVANVLDAYVTENTANSPLTIGGVSLAAHSLYVAVVGGIPAAVAKAIWSKKAPGCNYNGNTTITVVDDNSGYSPPLPSYQVTFTTPASIRMILSARLADNSQVPSDATAQINAAVLAAFSGADGGIRARIGSTVYASRFYAAVSALGPWVQIISIKVGSSNAPAATVIGSIAGTTLTLSSVVSGVPAVGQTIQDGTGHNNVLPGTTLISGAGLSGVVSLAQTVPSETLVMVAATLDSVAFNIDQSPSLNAADITVAFV